MQADLFSKTDDAPEVLDCGPAPFVHGAETSEQAAREIERFAGDQRQRVYAAIKAAGTDGLTDEQCRQLLGMRADSARARRVELVQSGHLCDSGKRRRTSSGRLAIAWVVPENKAGFAAAGGPGVKRQSDCRGSSPGFASSRCPRCGSDDFVDVRIHGGRSVRRDCARCKRFIAFTVWYGRRLEGQS